MPSNAKTVEAYLESLPADRREALTAVRRAIRDALDPDYSEGMQYGMIGYAVPHRVFPAGYHCDPAQPLMFAALASQKGHMSLYLMSVYMDPRDLAWFQDAWKATGRKLDMGKSCIRFRSLADVPLDVVAEAVRRMPAQRYVELYLKNLAGQKSKPRSKPAAKAKSPEKPTATAKAKAAPAARAATKAKLAPRKAKKAAAKRR
jgi:hypothetical protein